MKANHITVSSELANEHRHMCDMPVCEQSNGDKCHSSSLFLTSEEATYQAAQHGHRWEKKPF